LLYRTCLAAFDESIDVVLEVAEYRVVCCCFQVFKSASKYRCSSRIAYSANYYCKQPPKEHLNPESNFCPFKAARRFMSARAFFGQYVDYGDKTETEGMHMLHKHLWQLCNLLL